MMNNIITSNDNYPLPEERGGRGGKFSFSVSEYLYSLRFYILLVCILFVISIALGYIGFFNDRFIELQQFVENLKGPVQPYHPWIFFLFFFALIFLNNSFTSFLNIVFGTLLGIFPLLTIFVNGALVGWIAQEMDRTLFLELLSFAIFELSAFLLSAAIGLRMGREFLKMGGERDLKKELRNGIRFPHSHSSSPLYCGHH